MIRSLLLAIGLILAAGTAQRGNLPGAPPIR